MPPVDTGLSHIFDGSGHTYRLIDILAAVQWPWHFMLGTAVAVVAIGLFFSWRNCAHERRTGRQ